MCEVHFYPRCIERFHPDIVVNGKVIKGEPKPPTLIPDDLRLIHPSTSPSYLTIKEKKPRNPKDRADPPPSKKVKVEVC